MKIIECKRYNNELSRIIIPVGLVAVLLYTCGCMQITGIKKATLGTWILESNNGIDLSAGIQQYDRVDNYKGIGETENKTGRKR